MTSLASPRAWCSILLASAALVACGGDDTGGTSTTDNDATNPGGNLAPTADIERPRPDAVVAAGEPVAFTGNAADDRDRPADLHVIWTSDRRTAPLFDGPPNALGGTTFEIADLEPGDHVITMGVTDSGGLVGTASITLIVNSGPTAPEVAITPAAPIASDALTAVITREATDPDRAATSLTYTYRWFRDGVAASVTTATVPASQTARGETWQVRVRAADGLTEGLEATASVTIGNSPPSCPAAAILPSAGDTTRDLTCRCNGWADADGDDPDDTCAFYAEDALLAEGPCVLPASATSKGMDVRCVYTPGDGADTGPPRESAAVLIVNAPPSTPTTIIAPTTADAATDLTCSLGAASTDPDGDSLTYTASWYVNGHANAGVTLATVTAGALTTAAGTHARRGDAVHCALTATDGAAVSAPGPSAQVVLGNAPPEVANVAVTPAPGSTGVHEDTILVCDAPTVTDADGDTLTRTYVWYVDGVLVDGATSQNLTGAHFARGDLVTCAIVVDDGQGTPITSEVSKTALTIGNAPPSLVGAALTPATVHANGQLTCTPEGWSDPDGDPLEVTIRWLAVDDGVLTVIPGEAGGTLTPDMLSAGDQVVCEVTPKNGAVLGAPVTSAPATITAPTPEAPVVTVTAPATPGAPVRCDFVTPARNFAGAVTYTYHWRVNGGAENAGTSTLATASDCDLVACRAVATDGATTLSSAPAALLLPVGDDCVTGDACRPAVCDPAGGCDFFLASDLPCDDGDACTTEDTCDAGFCIAEGFAGDDTPCEDGLYCTGGDRCDGAGTCRAGGDPCARPAGSCLIGQCDEIGQECLVDARPVDSQCQDNNGCTTNERCTASGVCLPGPAPDCSGAGDECNQGVCRSLGPDDYVCDTQPRPTGALCTSDSFCTVQSRCDGDGLCAGGVDRDCQSEIGDQCNTAYCDPLLGRCVKTAAPHGTPCDDGNGCTLTDSCSNGFCVGSNDVCVEEQINTVYDGEQRPSLLSLGFGRYATLWWENVVTTTSVPGHLYLRLSDARGGRENTEERITSAGRPAQWETRMAIRAGGDFAFPYYDGRAYLQHSYPNSCLNWNPTSGSITGTFNGVAYDYAGVELVDAEIDDTNMTVWSCGGVLAKGEVAAARMLTLDLAGAFGLVVAADVRLEGNRTALATTPFGDREIYYYPPTGLMTFGARRTLFTAVDVESAGSWDARALPDGSGRFWVASIVDGQGAVLVRRYQTSGDLDHGGTALLSEAFAAGWSLHTLRILPGPDGGFILVLGAARDDGTGQNVYYRRYASNGTAIDSEHLMVNAQAVGDQRLGGADVFSDGGFVVVWDDSQGDTGGWAVKARLFNAEGAARSAEMRVNTITAGVQHLPEVVVLDTDEWVVAFVDDAARVWTRRYLHSGQSSVGALDWRLNASVTGNQKNPVAALGPNGLVFAAYETAVTGQSRSRIVARFVNPVGPTVGAELQLNETGSGTLSNPDLAAGPSTYVGVWQAFDQGGTTGEDIRARVFDSQGAPLSADIVVNQTLPGTQQRPAVAVDASGNFIVVWMGVRGGATQAGFFRAFGPTGAPLTDEQHLTVAEAHRPYPDVAFGPDGVALIAASDNSVSAEITLQKVNLSGALVGAQWTQTRPWAHRAPKIAMQSGGQRFTVCYDRQLSSNVDALGCQGFDWATLTPLEAESVFGRTASEPPRTVVVAPLSGGRTAVAFQTGPYSDAEAGVSVSVTDTLGQPVGPGIVATRVQEGGQRHPSVVPFGGSNAVVFWEDSTRDGSGTGVYFRVLTGL